MKRVRQLGAWSLLVLGCPLVVWAQDEYRAATIPDALRQGAHAVVRRHETVYTVKSPGEAVHRVRSVVTVLDEQGDDAAELVVGYSKLVRVNDIEGTLYDAAGNVVKKLKKADIADYSSFQDGNLFDDNRYRAARFSQRPPYPYTVEFVTELIDRNLMAYPSWHPHADRDRSVEQAFMVVYMPPNLPLRYREFNLKTPVRITEELIDNQPVRSYAWRVDTLRAVAAEPLSPPDHEWLPTVFTAPSRFEVQGYAGSGATWQDLGRFDYELNKDRDHLPDELSRHIRTLTAAEPTTAGKVKRIYAYLQETTRYVSVQRGIGGWQTIPASEVAARQYGDCKALVNYTKAMLKVAGVPAYVASIWGGEDVPAQLPDFPSFQSNHVILCVPDGRDTLWLECTSQHNPLGYLGSFTGGRYALLATPTGGKLVQTPTYKPADNRQTRRIDVTLLEAGNAVMTAHTQYSGLQSESRSAVIHNTNEADRREWLQKQIGLPSFELAEFSLSETPARIPVVTERLRLNVRNWAKPSGTRLFLPLNPLSSLGMITAPAKPRQMPLVLGQQYDFEDTDTVRITLPAGYVPEFSLTPTVIESTFGQYRAAATVTGDKLVYTRRLTMHRGRYPAAAYVDWVDFRRKIAKADKAQLVLVKP